jgi:hypothetical protein
LRSAIVRFPERTGQKIVCERQFSNFGMEHFQVNRWFRRLRFARENLGCALQKLGSPRRDLVRVNVELLRQLGECFLALQSS